MCRDEHVADWSVAVYRHPEDDRVLPSVLFFLKTRKQWKLIFFQSREIIQQHNMHQHYYLIKYRVNIKDTGRKTFWRVWILLGGLCIDFGDGFILGV